MKCCRHGTTWIHDPPIIARAPRNFAARKIRFACEAPHSTLPYPTRQPFHRAFFRGDIPLMPVPIYLRIVARNYYLALGEGITVIPAMSESLERNPASIKAARYISTPNIMSNSRKY